MAMKRTDDMKLKRLTGNWNTYNISDDQFYYWKIGEANLWIRRDKNEIYIATSHDKNIAAQNIDHMPEDLEWARFAIKEEIISIELTPAMPDRPLVVKPEASFYLTVGTKRTIYVRIPVWICISIVAKAKNKLLGIPSVILSNTWFGDLVDGELCYWLSSGARSKIEPDPSRPYMTICPITLQNESDENLLVEKFVVRADNSTLFVYNGQLYTDEILISFKGKDKFSSIAFKGRPRKEFSGATRIADPKKKQNKKILAKSFDSIKGDHLLGMPIK
ncbi:MAG: DUF432 domain-containing protein [Calditrichaeota bacterium]|nr:MAG: DUF432 domain-containing protein [Calditrichota bacterium]